MKVRNVRYVCPVQPSLWFSSLNTWLPLSLTFCPRRSNFLHHLLFFSHIFCLLNFFFFQDITDPCCQFFWGHGNTEIFSSTSQYQKIGWCALPLSHSIINKPSNSKVAMTNRKGRWGISHSDGCSSWNASTASAPHLLKKSHFSQIKTEFLRRLQHLQSQSSTYFQEWWASSSGESFWTSLWSPGVGMDPEVGWQCAPAQPHPIPQSTPSHSEPCLSQHSPLKTCRMAGSPQLLLSFFQRSHLKLCQVLPSFL